MKLIHLENIITRYFGVTPVHTGWQGWIIGIWQRWDAIHYQRIAQSGNSDELLSAFFPLFPWLGRLVANLTHTPVLFGLLVIANLAFIGSLFVMYRLTAEWFSPDLARLSTDF